MRIYKKSRNPYLNLIKSIGNIYNDNNINTEEKLNEYKIKNSYVSNKINMKNPWHIFMYNFIQILNSTFIDNNTKYTSITKELAWFENATRVHDWVVTKPIRNQKHA